MVINDNKVINNHDSDYHIKNLQLHGDAMERCLLGIGMARGTLW